MSTDRTCPGIHSGRVCDEPIPDTAIRCPGCIARMAVLLRGGAELWPELDATIRRQTRIASVGAARAHRDPRPYAGPLCRLEDGCRHVSCEQIVWTGIGAARVAVDEEPIPNEELLPVNLVALEAQWAIRNTVVTWARIVADRVPGDGSTEVVLRWLAKRVDDLARHPAAEEAWDELENALAVLEVTVDTRQPATYAGRCGACGRDLYAEPGSDVAHCRPCGLDHAVQDQRSSMLDEISDQLMRPSEIVRVVPVLSGLYVTRDDVKRWTTRGLLVAHGRDALSRPLYRVSEVVEAARRAEPKRRSRAQ